MVLSTRASLQLGALALLAFPAQAPANEHVEGNLPNILIVIMDDVGVDHVQAYGEHPINSVTPTLDALAANGVLFRNAWVTPACSPTRASLLTGRYPSRHGITTVLKVTDPHGLDSAEETLPEALRAATGGAYTSFATGKWHLMGAADPLDHPRKQGFAHHWGSAGNIPDFFNWTKLVDGVEEPSTVYATTDTTNSAMTLIESIEEPWLGWMGFNAAHTPLHAPPAHLSSSFPLSGGPNQSAPMHMRAMVEALDAELGRLIAWLPPEMLANTVIVVLGDNGTWGPCVEPPFDPQRAKGTPYEGGVNVPFLVSGYGVVNPGRESEALVSAVDLMPTLLELIGADPAQALPGVQLDGVSFAPVLAGAPFPNSRRFVYTEGRLPLPPDPAVRESWSMRSKRYKYVYQRSVQASGTEVILHELYDLAIDPFELNNLWLDHDFGLPLASPPLIQEGLALRATF